MPRPDFILMTSGMTCWYTGVQETVSFLKRVIPNVPVILGGLYATLCREHAVRSSGAEHVISGQISLNPIPLFDLLGMNSPSAQPIPKTDDLVPAFEPYDRLEGIAIRGTAVLNSTMGQG